MDTYTQLELDEMQRTYGDITLRWTGTLWSVEFPENADLDTYNEEKYADYMDALNRFMEVVAESRA